ncbi:hypothetical protein IWQ56_005677, partial [Coemansia nantahalensis]
DGADGGPVPGRQDGGQARQRRDRGGDGRVDSVPAGHGQNAAAEPKAGAGPDAVRGRGRLLPADRQPGGRARAVPRAGAEPGGRDAREGAQAGSQRYHARRAGAARRHDARRAAGGVWRTGGRHGRAVPGDRNQPDGDCQDPDAGGGDEHGGRSRRRHGHGHCARARAARAVQGHRRNAAARRALLAAVLPAAGAVCAPGPQPPLRRRRQASHAVRAGREHGRRRHCCCRRHPRRRHQDPPPVVVAAVPAVPRPGRHRIAHPADRGPAGVLQGHRPPLPHHRAAVWHCADDVRSAAKGPRVV